MIFINRLVVYWFQKDKIYEKSIFNLLPFAIVMIFGCTNLPMKNDPNFDPNVESPFYKIGMGPKILIDGGHKNAFVDYDLIQPFV